MLSKTKKIALFLMIILLSSCGGSPAPASSGTPADEIDIAVRETSDYLNKQLSPGYKLMILNIQSDFPALSEYIIDELIANTVNDRVFSMVDRQQLNVIRAELDFQLSGEVDDATAQTLGRMAGAQIIISGAISKIGDLYRLRIRALNVQTAGIEGQFNRNIPDSPTVAALAKSRATGYFVGTAPVRNQQGTAPAAQVTATVPVVPATVAPAVTKQPEPTLQVTYEIGGRGPAGGFVFYDKGNNSGGWQYLEAIPVDFEFRSAWGETATTDVASLFVRGYGGWRLPTRIELNQMYINLKQKRLGDFKDDWYWSSSESDASDAWAQYFQNSTQNPERKWRTFLIRAVRQF